MNRELNGCFSSLLNESKARINLTLTPSSYSRLSSISSRHNLSRSHFLTLLLHDRSFLKSKKIEFLRSQKLASQSSKYKNYSKLLDQFIDYLF
jgi:hypothetical protein